MLYVKTDIGTEPVIAEAVFPAPPERVFKAWIEADQIMRWFGPEAGSLVSAETDARVGGKWCFVVADGADGRSQLEGDYLAVDPNARLQFTWRHVKIHSDGKRDATPSSTVTVTFRAEGAATRVHLIHEGILKSEGREGVGSGWERTFGHLAAMFVS